MISDYMDDLLSPIVTEEEHVFFFFLCAILEEVEISSKETKFVLLLL